MFLAEILKVKGAIFFTSIMKTSQAVTTKTVCIWKIWLSVISENALGQSDSRIF